MAETPRRFVRVPDELWDKASAKANRQNRTMSEVVRHLLALYAYDEDGPSTGDAVKTLRDLLNEAL